MVLDLLFKLDPFNYVLLSNLFEVLTDSLLCLIEHVIAFDVFLDMLECDLVVLVYFIAGLWARKLLKHFLVLVIIHN